MKLIFGLGNPGDRYSATRHNIGFMAVDKLATRKNKIIGTLKKKNLTAKCLIDQEEVILAKPRTFMNLSGEAVTSLASFFKIDAENIIVIHDDLDLDFGRIKIKIGGGHGGHNGIRSIVSYLGSGDFTRIKIGIGRPQTGGDISGYVLNPFSVEEKGDLDRILERSAEAAEAVVREGALKAMNRFNS